MTDQGTYFRNERGEMLRFLPEKISRCIEFGCSQGLFSKKVKEMYQAECWGVDLDEDSVKAASAYLDRVICGDATEVLATLPEAYFDCMVCNDFLEHLADPGIFLKNAARVMVSGGVLVASVPNVRSWSNILELLVHKDWKYKDSGILDKTHLRFFTLKSFRRFLQENGQEILLLEGTRPSSSKLFLVADILSLGFIHDMKFSGLAVRSRFNK